MRQGLTLSSFFFGFFCATFLETLGQSSVWPVMTSELQSVLPTGRYVIEKTICKDEAPANEKLDPGLFPLELIHRQGTSILRQRIHSHCSYEQELYLHPQHETGSYAIAFGSSKQLGNCYFSPTSFVGINGSIAKIKIQQKAENWELSWQKNPSLLDCRGKSAAWSLKAVGKASKSLRLATSEKSLLPARIN